MVVINDYLLDEDMCLLKISVVATDVVAVAVSLFRGAKLALLECLKPILHCKRCKIAVGEDILTP